MAKGFTDVRALEGGWQAWLDFTGSEPSPRDSVGTEKHPTAQVL
jgi:3-mercaptopyruvate sulfurtransferase SseA